jgi:hypothetical protein
MEPLIIGLPIVQNTPNLKDNYFRLKRHHLRLENIISFEPWHSLLHIHMILNLRLSFRCLLVQMIISFESGGNILYLDVTVARLGSMNTILLFKKDIRQKTVHR